jgi:hypothetical protein
MKRRLFHATLHQVSIKECCTDMARQYLVCTITINSDQPQMRIEGDYVPQFYEAIKRLVPRTRWSYVSSGRYWLVDKVFYDQICELASEHFDRIDFFDNGQPRIIFPEKEVEHGR